MKATRALFSATVLVFMLSLQSTVLSGATQGASAGPLPVDPEFKPRSGTYFYTVDFNDMNIGNASIIVANESDQYKVQVRARTIGVVDRIYRLRYRGEAVMGTDPVAPVKITMQQDVRSTEKITSINFQGNGAIKSIETKSQDGDTVDYKVRNVRTDKFILDPFSATYLVRGLDWETGVEKVFDVFPGKYQYELRLKCTGKETLDVAGEKRDAWVIVPTVINLDPEKRGEDAKKKPANVKIYVSADGLRDVLKIEASHTLGQFLARMDRFEPSEAQADKGPVKTQGNAMENN